METNTPETDALFRKLEKLLPDQSPFYDMHEHAQKLERERDEQWLQYVHPKHGLCGLCGNTGMLDTRKTAISAVGVNAGVLAFCICPNGRAQRAAKC